MIKLVLAIKKAKINSEYRKRLKIPFGIFYWNKFLAWSLVHYLNKLNKKVISKRKIIDSLTIKRDLKIDITEQNAKAMYDQIKRDYGL